MALCISSPPACVAASASFSPVFNHRKVISVTVVSIPATEPEEPSPVPLTR